MQNDRQGTLAMQPKMDTVYEYRYTAGNMSNTLFCVKVVMFGLCNFLLLIVFSAIQ